MRNNNGQRGTSGKIGGLKFATEFDFEEENAKFNKDDLEKELKAKLNLGGYMIYYIYNFIGDPSLQILYMVHK